MHLPFRQTENGFTLIELLISISIIVIVTGALVPSFSNYIRTQNLRQAQEQLRSDLRSIQNKALTGTLSSETFSGNPIKYWGVRFAKNSGTYDFFVASALSCPTTLPGLQNQGSGKFNSGIVIKNNISGYECLFFNISDGGISNTAGITSSTILMGYPDDTKDLGVYFNNAGLVCSVVGCAN